MGVRPKFTKRDIELIFRERRERIDEVTINRLKLIGERFVRNARQKTVDQGGFNDQTGNLRSSIGYEVLKHGITMHENYEDSKRGYDKSRGKAKARTFIETLKDKFSTGYCLIVVAGMEYAAAVESRGRDVLTGSAQSAETDLHEAMIAISKKINRR